MATLIEKAQEAQAQARKKLKEASKLADAINLLPKALTEHDWGEGVWVDLDEWWDSIAISIRLSGEAKTQDTVDAIKDYLGKELRFSFERIVHEYQDSFCYTGKLENTVIDDKAVTINLGSTPKPQNCRLIKKLVTKKVEVYEAFCEDTGQAI